VIIQSRTICRKTEHLQVQLPEAVNSVHGMMDGHCHANSTTPCITIPWHFVQIACSAGLAACQCLLLCSSISHCRSTKKFNITFPADDRILNTFLNGNVECFHSILQCLLSVSQRQIHISSTVRMHLKITSPT